jgi:flagellar FliL protein
MAQSAKPAAAKPADPTVQKKSSKTLVIGAAVSLLVIIAAGGGWYFSKGKGDAHHADEIKIAPPKTPIFVALEPFTVNLQRESSDQYLQLGLSMKVFEVEIESKIKTNLPEIRSKILQLLTTKTATELLTAEGKTRLVKEIMSMSNTVIGISNLPAPAAAAIPVAAVAAEHSTAEQHTPDAGAEPASAPAATAAPKPAEPKGIVDVLFTSFIIQ